MNLPIKPCQNKASPQTGLRAAKIMHPQVPIQRKPEYESGSSILSYSKSVQAVQADLTKKIILYSKGRLFHNLGPMIVMMESKES